MALNGYAFSLDDSTKKGSSIKLQGMGKTYFLMDDDPSVTSRSVQHFCRLYKKRICGEMARCVDDHVTVLCC